MGFFWTCGEKLSVSLSGDRYLGKLLEFPKACQASLSSSKRERGLSLETLQCKRVSSSWQGRISWFAWSCDGKVRIPLELRVDPGDLLMSTHRSHMSFGVSRVTSGFPAHRCRDEWGLMSGGGGTLRVPLHFLHRYWGLCGVGTVESGLILC